jgi:D-arabinose 1-dehydrogenase-like Zn-dependent alcohol dehydrogenase
MIFGQYTFAASMIGPPSEIEEMFRFAALHDIRTAVEVVPMEQVNGAMAKKCVAIRLATGWCWRRN